MNGKILISVFIIFFTIGLVGGFISSGKYKNNNHTANTYLKASQKTGTVSYSNQ